MNDLQKETAGFALEEKPLTIIHGPPGTGKTSTLVEIILQLVEKGKKVLICSPSNVAVDTIAERLLTFIDNTSENICRIGHPVRMLEEVRNISVDTIIETKTNIQKSMSQLLKDLKKAKGNALKIKAEIEQLKQLRKKEIIQLFRQCQIVFATTVGSGFTELSEYLREDDTYFDVVIIDESAQAKECECFVPILKGKR